MMKRSLIGLAVALVLVAVGGCDTGRGWFRRDRDAEGLSGNGAATDGEGADGADGDLVAEFRRGLRVRRLPNDLVVMTKENHAAPVASVYVVVRAGGILEDEYLGAGISHVTEHLVAGGTTQNRTEAEIRETVARIGAVTNAMTSSDRTMYFIDTTPEHVDTATDLLADYITGARIPQEEFQREIGVIQREILTGSGDASRQAYYLLQKSMFRDLPQGVRTIGYAENIQQISRQDVVDYYRRRYVPSNAVVCAAGDFDGAEVLDMLAEAFGDWRGPHAGPIGLPEPRPPVTDIEAVKEMDTELAHVLVGWHSISLQHPDLYALDVLAGVLGRGDSSRLAADLKLERDLVRSIEAWNYTPEWPGGQFVVNFVCDPENIDTVRAAIRRHVDRLLDEPPTREEVAKVKKQVIAETVLGLRTASSQARRLASDQLVLGDPMFSARYAQNLQGVTREDVLRVARIYLSPQNRTVTAIVRPDRGGEGGAAEIEAAEPARTTLIEMPETGMRLLVYRTPGQPAVSMIAAMKAGQSYESAETAGISSMVARTLLRGTGSRSEQEIAGFFDRIGGRIEAQSGWNSLYVQALALRADLEPAFDAFADVVMNPAFDADQLASTRQRQLDALSAVRSQPTGQASLYFNSQFFLDSPYRFPPTGTEASIEGMTIDRLRSFYERVRTGGNLVLTVAGDVDPGRIERMARKAFADLEPGPGLAAPTGAEARRVDGMEIHVQETSKPSAVVMVGYPGMDLFNLEDRFAMDIFDTIISGYYMPGGWLHKVLRGQQLVYAVHYSGRQGLRPGYYRSIAICRPERATHVARLLVNLAEHGRQYRVTEDDLAKARATVLTARKMSRQTPEGVAFMMTLDELYGLGHRFEETYTKRIRAAEAADVERVARKYVTAPVVTISTPQPDLVDHAAIRKPMPESEVRELIEAAPEAMPEPSAHASPQ